MRSLLIVAQADAAAFASGADAVVADAAVAASGGCKLYLRVRAHEDIQAAARLHPAGVALAGSAGGVDVQRLGAGLAVEEARLGLPDGALKILAFAIETPEAALALPGYRGASGRLAGLIVTRTPALRGSPWRLARDLCVIAAHAAGVPVLDAPFDDLADLEGLRAEALLAREDGFDGKLALSPQQVAVINAAFAR